MIENAIRAAKLDTTLYNAVEHEESLTGQTALLVVIVSALAGVGNALMRGGLIGQVLGGVVAGLFGWYVGSFVMDWIGRRFFDGESDFGQMQRVFGFAHAPRALGVIPFLGWVAFFWMAAATVVAVREGQDFSTGDAVITVVAGWLVTVIASGIVFAIF